ncbi:MAG: S1 family peptidase [Ignavibacteria bacterium]|nr:S1 family peptidase [Ignavibacteria bacterium]
MWRLKIRSPGAYSINLIYDIFSLPDWATLYLYNEDKSYVIGAFTSDNNQQHGQFATQPVPGNAITLEYHEPANVRGLGRINISKVIHAYRPTFNKRAWQTGAPDNLLGKVLDFGDSGPCNINVRCPEWASWDQQIRFVAMIITSSGTRLCSGALINNSRQDLTPFFLTANHCLKGNPDTWIIMFNYESRGCANINGPTNQTISGTMTVANNSASDFALLSLSQRPPGSYRTYYAGWSRPNTPAQSSVGIHHPRGDIKKISHDYDPVVSSDYEPDPYLLDSHWKVRDWDQGTTEPSSSGSPLFDQNRRIVGQLYGGSAACGNDLPDYYGKFSMSWDYGSTYSTRLRDWLDPINSGSSTLDGMEGPPTEPTNVVITNPNQIGMSPRLSWSASSSPHGIAYYQIFRTPSYYNPLN